MMRPASALSVMRVARLARPASAPARARPVATRAAGAAPGGESSEKPAAGEATHPPEKQEPSSSAPARRSRRSAREGVEGGSAGGAGGGLMRQPVFSMLEPWERSLIGSLMPRAPRRMMGGLMPSITDMFDLMEQALPTAHGSMRMDVSETPKEYHVALELPGFKKEDVKVEVDQHVLRITADRKEERKDEEGVTYHRVERASHMTRAITMPENADMHTVKAKMEHGVLHVAVPKHAEAEAEEEKVKAVAIE